MRIAVLIVLCVLATGRATMGEIVHLHGALE
jgi:hypothetical protein